MGEQGARSGTLREQTAPRSPLPEIRTAVLSDVPQLETLMSPFVATGDLLPRSNYDLCRHIKEYVVVEAGGEIVACGALKIFSPTLAEAAGLAVGGAWPGPGLGGRRGPAPVVD